MWRIVLIFACSVALQVSAQIPSVRLPTLPALRSPALQPLSSETDALQRHVESDLRRVRIRELLHTHAAVIDSDAHGAPIVRNEVLMFSPPEAALAAALSAGFAVARELSLDGIDARIVVLRAPQGVTTTRALTQLQKLDPQGIHDFNHIYLGSGAVNGAADPAASETASLQNDSRHATLKLGLIDGGIASRHPVFGAIQLHEHGCSDHPVPSAHGTAVASLMVGSAGRFHGAASQAELYAADVYCGLPTGGAVDAVADAFAWLAREQVSVINVSLVGPPNLMLENVVRRVIEKGQIVVAAVGNDGPAAPPLYPASYAGVVGVTAVDGRDRALPEAARGRQVEFAAPGADMAAANLPLGFAVVRGTSFAAPIVAGLLAARERDINKASAADTIRDLARSAQDLGAAGPDPVYGSGLVGGAVRPPVDLADEHGGQRN